MEDSKLEIKIKLFKEEAMEKLKGKVQPRKDAAGEPIYVREDAIGLSSLLQKFNTTLHSPKDFKMYIKLMDRIRRSYLQDNGEIEMSKDEAIFLKAYLTGLPEKDGKGQSLVEYEIRTLEGIKEQLDKIV